MLPTVLKLLDICSLSIITFKIFFIFFFHLIIFISLQKYKFTNKEKKKRTYTCVCLWMKSINLFWVYLYNLKWITNCNLRLHVYKICSMHIQFVLHYCYVLPILVSLKTMENIIDILNTYARYFVWHFALSIALQ